MVSRSARRAVQSCVTLGAVLLMASCGSSGPADNGIASKSASEIYTTAKATTAAATSVRYSGTVDDSGKSISLDIVAAGTRGGGTITLGGSTLHIVASGTSLYLKATAAAWTKLGAPSAAAKVVDGKWLQTSTSDKSFGAFANFTNLSKLVESISAKHAPSKGKQTTFNGRGAITLTDPGNATLLVATTGKPYILEINSTQTGNTGTITFSGYNSSQPPAVPTGALNIDALSGSGGG